MRIAIAGGNGTVGRWATAAAADRGHEVLVLSRRTGHDLETGDGLAPALVGVDALIDVTSLSSTSKKRSVEFFEKVTRNLLDAETASGVGHYIALSIVGIDDIDASYYGGKLAQERAVTGGDVPWSILRAAQFHEFAEQVLVRGAVGPLAAVPTALIRPVAAREVGARLVDIAETGPAGRTRDLVGPEDERLIDLVRRMLAHDGVKRPTIEITLPGLYWKAIASGVLRGTPGADQGSITFDEWLDLDHRP
ncbi:SDR family oxidoreductase [Leifsonia virtsii]|uniref:NAD(P)H-binding protein n=1 Tax=Leifsonia virtsii TaxID=3035915 RepID=A0ABT8IVJ9_9MICO|nr:NAD(P)H-binding protein [Leifsonia virtsii]MDN4596841.1 NAD(P)H-binding protein [Leifsonia virtsii]